MDKTGNQTLDALFDAAAEKARIDEITYRDLMGEIMPNTVAGARVGKLPYRDWAPLVPLVRYMGYRKDTVKFFVPNKHNGWETYIQFVDWYDQVKDPRITAPEAARLLLWSGNVRVHCGCPAFLFWGFEYIMTQLDAAIVPEQRFPKIKNPQLKGVVCKHLLRTLKVLPFHLGDIAKAIAAERKIAGGETKPSPATPKTKRS